MTLVCVLEMLLLHDACLRFGDASITRMFE